MIDFRFEEDFAIAQNQNMEAMIVLAIILKLFPALKDNVRVSILERLKYADLKYEENYNRRMKVKVIRSTKIS